MSQGLLLTPLRLGVAVLLFASAACTGDVGKPDPNDPGAGGDASAGDDDPLLGSLAPEEQALFQQINTERELRGLVPVSLDADLICAARRHSNDIGESGSCSHTGSDGSDPTVRVVDCGGSDWSGEIVACGQNSPRGAIEAWLDSAEHNGIMLGGGRRGVGVAVHASYWTAIFLD